jgi:ABC-type phosphate/phosphonate transport system substrate-binding protein
MTRQNIRRKSQGNRATMPFIANARMYAVCPEAETAWRELISHIAADAGTAFEYLTYAAPQPLEQLWRRADLGCVQMCGYPIARALAHVTPLASPIPAAPWANHQPVYRSDLIVREDAPYESLADTFGGTAGWTVEHSHSGFNAFRYHLLAHRSDDRPQLYRKTIGNLITARAILDHVIDGKIDVGPLDAYWHVLMRKYAADLTDKVRIIDVTDTAPMPAFVASQSLPAEIVLRLREAFSNAARMPWFAKFGEALLIEGFAPATQDSFDQTLAWSTEANAAGYLVPA